MMFGKKSSLRVSYPNPNNMQIHRAINAITQASVHCQSTTDNAHLLPISRRMAATAATQGV